ncbi:TPA: hypothetical protein NJ217_003680 [Vibrio parahaemolyticus]|uniref:hypothetical protein n=1 Tax=Vibrio parahaemolyticus TaxID=670 RepID=UPI00111D1E82|nr:hypothetical protein [Vibrio parahaemolyticus]HCG6653590.1 hypothetical protein [Vibrio parahaemolyticus]
MVQPMVNIFETTNLIENELVALHESVSFKFNAVVEEFITILRSSDSLVFVPCSMGKDSSTVLNAASEAYRVCIQNGWIEKNRPLIVSTVDTLSESLPMVMYTRWVKSKFIDYAKDNDINVYYDIVTPSFHEEYANKYLTSNKLIPNAQRNSDCSSILKIVPSERYLKNLLDRFKSDEELQQYTRFDVICATGQRNNESTKRKGNMVIQGTSDKSISDLLKEMKESDLNTGYPLFLYAPIRDWSTQEVFTSLELSGAKPLTRSLGGLPPLPGFLSDFALLLAIYGNASSDVCEIAVGQKNSNGCNGSSRFGCTLCTMVQHDKTQNSLAKHTRWKVFLQEEVLRIRDFMFQLSCNMDARMMHAKAIDFAAYQRVAFQPNVLKVKYLEKLVRYFSQISIESSKKAEEFKRLYKSGYVDQHEGVIDIKNDRSLNAKARRAFLDMYIQEAQKPLINIFSEKHAAYLSFRWSLDGVNALPYRPLVIWNELLRGNGWIPYPKSNAEYESIHGKISINSSKLPEAVLMKTLNVDNDPVRFIDNHKSFLSYWERPIDASDLNESDFNCTTKNLPKTQLPVKVSIAHNLKLEPISQDTSRSKHCDLLGRISVMVNAERVELFDLLSSNSDKVIKLECNGRKASSAFSEYFKTSLLKGYANKKALNWYIEIDEQVSSIDFSSIQEATKVIYASFSSMFGGGEINTKLSIPYLSHVTDIQYQEKARKVKPSLDFTKRVAKIRSGKITKGTTRLSFYNLETNPRLHYAHADNHRVLHPDIDLLGEEVKDVFTPAHYIDPNAALGDKLNIVVNERTLSQWHLTQPYKRIKAEHDLALIQNIRRRRLSLSNRKQSVRSTQLGAVARSMVETGAVRISLKYYPTFLDIAKRTELLSELGCFDYQDMNASELKQLPFMVSMQKHRVDKAKLLLHVRERRNAIRHKIKLQLSRPLEGCESRLRNHCDRLKKYLARFGESTVKLNNPTLFLTDNQPQIHRTLKCWSLLSSDSFKSIEEFYKSSLSSNQLTELNAKPSIKKEMTHFTIEQLNSVVSVLEQSIAMNWALKGVYSNAMNSIDSETVSKIAKVSKDLSNLKFDDVFKYKSSEEYLCLKTELRNLNAALYTRLSNIETPASNVINLDKQDFLASFNPSVENYLTRLGEYESNLSEALITLEWFKAQIEDIKRFSLRETISKFSLEQRLSLSTDLCTMPVNTNVTISPDRVDSNMHTTKVTKRSTRNVTPKPLLESLLNL